MASVVSFFVEFCWLLLVVVGFGRVWSVFVGFGRFFFRVCAYYFIVRARNGKTTFFLGAL